MLCWCQLKFWFWSGAGQIKRKIAIVFDPSIYWQGVCKHLVVNAPSVGIVRCSKNPVDAREKNNQQRAKSLSLAGALDARVKGQQILLDASEVTMSGLRLRQSVPFPTGYFPKPSCQWGQRRKSRSQLALTESLSSRQHLYLPRLHSSCRPQCRGSSRPNVASLQILFSGYTEVG